MKIYIKYGVLGAVGLIAYSIMINMTGVDRSDAFVYFRWASILIPFFCIFKGIKEKRDIECQGIITYNESFKLGMLITSVITVIYAIFTFINFTFINTGFLAYHMHRKVQDLKNSGNSEETIKSSISLSQKISTPIGGTIATFIFSIVVGAFISLILAAILRKEKEEQI